MRRLVLHLMIAAAAALTTAIALAPSAGAAGEATRLTIVGRGYGHGVGMSQYGACGCARRGWTWQRIIKHYYTGVQIGRVADRTIRVLLATGQSSVRVSAGRTYRVDAAGAASQPIPAGKQATVTWSGGRYRVRAAGQTWTFTKPVSFFCEGSTVRLGNATQNGWSAAARAAYRGSLRISRSGGAFTVVNHLPLEQYLYGVLPKEVSPRWPAAALRAQAVAARSFATQRIGGGGAFDVYCTTRSQAYGGAGSESTVTTAAVKATRGMVPTYCGHPIGAYYYASSGGQTENVENVWAGGPVPYLKAVDDPYDKGSAYSAWPENPLVRSASSIARSLGSTYRPAGSLRAIWVSRRGVSPRVVKAYVIGSRGVRAVTGQVLRERLGLRSTWFEVRTLSISPSGKTTVAAGGTVLLRGRTFPALTTKDKLTLRYRVGGGWRAQRVAADAIRTRRVSLGGGRSATYSTYAVRVQPTRATTYAFAVGRARSPQVTVRITD